MFYDLNISSNATLETAPETAPKTTRGKILFMLSQNPHFTKQDLMNRLGKASGTIKEHIRNLQKDG